MIKHTQVTNHKGSVDIGILTGDDKTCVTIFKPWVELLYSGEPDHADGVRLAKRLYAAFFGDANIVVK